MNIVKRIYTAPIVKIINGDLGTALAIEYDGLSFMGYSQCHPQDNDFASARVGYNIALSRARISALKHEYNKAKERYNNKY